MWQPFDSRIRTTPRRPRNIRARRTSLERPEDRQLLSYSEESRSATGPEYRAVASGTSITTASPTSP
jgi:hypothetical protein